MMVYSGLLFFAHHYAECDGACLFSYKYKALFLLSLSLSSSLLASTDKRLLASTIGLCIGSMFRIIREPYSPLWQGNHRTCGSYFCTKVCAFQKLINIFVSDF